MLKVMETKLKPGGLDFAKTHPDPKDRIEKVDETLVEASRESRRRRPSRGLPRQARYQAALGSI